jgi:DNA-binding MarR family transcriptional regulator
MSRVGDETDDDSPMEVAVHEDVNLRFAMVPEWLIDADVSAGAVRMFALLHRYAGRSRATAWPAIRTLAERLRVSVPTARRHVQELESVGAVTVSRRRRLDGSQTSNTYTLHGLPPITSDRGAPVMGDRA